MIHFFRFRRSLLGLCAVATVSLGAAPAFSDTAPIEPSASLVGNYLAGRHAESERNLSLAADFLKAVLAQSPDVPDLQRRTFVLLAMEGRIAEALPFALKTQDGRPNDTVVNLLLATEEIKNKQFSKAAERLKGLPDTGLSGLAAPLLLAWALVADKKTDESLAALVPLEKDTGLRSLYILHKGLILDFAGRPDEAIETLEELTALEETPSFRQVQLLGNLYERMEKGKAAAKLYDAYEAQNPDTSLLYSSRQRLQNQTIPAPLISSALDGAAEVHFGIANSLRQQRASETALLLGQLALYLKPNFPIMRILAGEILEVDQRYEDANAHYLKVPDDSAFAQTAQMRIATNFHDIGRIDDAIAIARKIAQARPNDPDPVRAIGDFLRASERYKEAIPEYDEAIRRVKDLNPSHWRLFYTRGIVLEREKFFKKSEEDFLKALELQPDQPFVLNYLGYSWIEQGRNLDQAQDMIRKAVSLRPNDGYIIDSLGWVYYQLGKYDDAVAELERAVNSRPEDPVINDHLGDAYWQVGRRKEARFQWLHSLSLNPTPDVEALVREKLKNGLKTQSDTIKKEVLKAPAEEG